MERPVPLSDWIVYLVVLGTVAAMLVGKWLMFFNDKKEESQIEQLDDTVEEIFEETIEKTIDEVVDEATK